MRTSSLAIALLATSFAIPSLALAQLKDVPPSLKQTAKCMLEILKTMPNVIEPKLGVTSSGGWVHPFLEYCAAEALTKFDPIRFDAKTDGSGGFSFLAVKSGLGAPEFHVTDAVMKKWNARCGANANVLFP
jgi:hypothetical protein